MMTGQLHPEGVALPVMRLSCTSVKPAHGVIQVDKVHKVRVFDTPCMANMGASLLPSHGCGTRMGAAIMCARSAAMPDRGV